MPEGVFPQATTSVQEAITRAVLHDKTTGVDLMRRGDLSKTKRYFGCLNEKGERMLRGGTEAGVPGLKRLGRNGFTEAEGESNIDSANSDKV